MAGASMNDIKARMKSVRSTMQITKAMELVATSKLRRAKEKAEKSRPFYETLISAIQNIGINNHETQSVWLNKPKENRKSLYIVIAGDRGLAGGYNANIFRLSEALSKGKDAIFLPIGKKALEYYRHRGQEIFLDSFGTAAEIGVGTSLTIASLVCEAYKRGEFDRATLVYTHFASMLSQLPIYEDLLPLSFDSAKEKTNNVCIEEEAEEMLEEIIPDFVGGVLYSAISDAQASESAARRSAMNAANKNAEEIINTLVLKYNRARQAIITQEITEIVSGAEAL